jgi:hypothetical protein
MKPLKYPIIISFIAGLALGLASYINALPERTYGTVSAFAINNASTDYEDDGSNSVAENELWTGAQIVDLPDFVSITTVYTSDFAKWKLNWDRSTLPVEPVTTTTYLVDISDAMVIATEISTITLPTAVGHDGKTITIINNSAGTITLATTGAQTVDGTTPPTLANPYDSITIVSDGANWIATNQVTHGTPP